MAVSQLFNEFMFFSCIGYFYECCFSSMKRHKWQNRGFFFGPICPIYGVGAVLCIVIFGHLYPNFRGQGVTETSIPEVFLICMAGSVILEYPTSYVLEKLFHARWWEYSKEFCNINGRICLPASIRFGVAGVLIVNYVVPLVLYVEAHFYHPVLSQLLSLFLMWIFGADAALTISSLKGLLEKVEQAEAEFNERMATAYISFEAKAALAKETPLGIVAGKVAEGGALLTDKMKEGGTAFTDKVKESGTAFTDKVKESGTAFTDKVKDTGSLVSEKAREYTLRLTKHERRSIDSIQTFKLDSPGPVARKMKENISGKEEEGPHLRFLFFGKNRRESYENERKGSL